MELTNEDVQAFWAKVDKRGKDDCWPWQGYVSHASGGYGIFDRRRNGQRKARRASRVAFTLSKGPIPSGLMVLHECDNPVCVNPKHLKLGTAKVNSQDMVRRKRHWTMTRPERIQRGENHWTARRGTGPLPRGEQHHNAKLTSGQVKAIRSKYDAGGVSQRQLAREYGVSQGTIWQIVNHHYWSHT